MLLRKLLVGLIIYGLIPLTQAEITVCAVPQLYTALESLHQISPIEYQVKYAVSSELYSKQVNQHIACDLVLSDDEKLPILLTRANLTDPYSLKALFRAPLILWSKDHGVVPDSYSKLQHSSFKSLALADARLTPVGFASHQVLNQKLPALKAHLQYHLYHAEHEYLIFSLINERLVQCGFISKPLALSSLGKIIGSYWEVPRSFGPDLLYYLILTQQGIKTAQAKTLYNLLLNSPEASAIFQQAGFASLED